MGNGDFFGARLKKYRKNKGITGIELARNIGISQGSLSDIERGKTNPSLGTIQNLAATTDIDLVWLITGKEAPQPEKQELPKTSGFFAEFETWAKETTAGEGYNWIANQIDELFPAFKRWREKNEAAASDQDKVA